MRNADQKHSRSRRSVLKAGVGGVVAGATSGAWSTAVRAQNSASSSICVRSPWAYYVLDGSAIGSAGEAIDCGNEGQLPLRALSSDLAQWSENPGWWSGNGVDRALEADWGVAQVGFDGLLNIDESAALVGIELLKPIRNFSEEVVYRFGKTVPGVLRYGLELKINGAGKPQVTVWDDNGVGVSIAGKQVISDVNGGHAVIFIYIDKRDAGSQTMALYQYEAGSAVQSNRIKDISFLGPISGGVPDAAKKVQLAARRNASGNLGQYLIGQIRGLHIMNFGSTPPSNVNDIMDQLSASAMQPVISMAGA